MSETFELSDAVLGAYADGELDRSAAAEVERALARDPAARRKLADIRRITMLVKGATRLGSASPAKVAENVVELVPVDRRAPAAERVPAGPEPVRIGLPHWSMAASILVGFLAALVLLQLTPGPTRDGVGWQHHALTFHRQLMDLTADDAAKRALLLDTPDLAEPAAASRFESLVHYRPVMPDLSAQGYRPIGARLIATPEGPLTYVVYEAPGQPPLGYSMIRPIASTPAAAEAARTQDDVQLVEWSDGPYRFGLSGELPEDALATLRDSVRGALAESLAGSGAATRQPAAAATQGPESL